MALSRIKSDMIADDAITTAKIDDETIVAADVVAGQIMNAKISSGAGDKIAHTKTTVGTAATLNIGPGASTAVRLDATPKLPVVNGSALTNLTAANFENNLPVLNGSAVTGLTAANLTGSFPTSPALSGAALTGVVTDFSPITNSMARLGLHIGAVEQLAKYNMIDQVIDDYEDATGVDAYNGLTAVGAYQDHSSSAHTVTALSGAALVTAEKVFGTSSIYFDGHGNSGSPGDGLTISNPDLAFGTGNFTVDLWVKFDGAPTAVQNMIGNRDASTNSHYENVWILHIESAGKKFGWNTGATYLLRGTTTPADDTWYHVAVTWDGTTLRLFVNGTIEDTDTSSKNYSISTILNIGTGDYWSTPDLKGWLDEIRITKGAALWTSNFDHTALTVGTATSNTKLLIHGEAQAAVANTGSSSSATRAGSAGAKYYSGANSNQTLISTTTETEGVGSAPTKASIVLQTEDEVGTATINDDLKAGVSRDALNYVDTTLAKISTWGSGNVYAANDVTMPGTVMTKIITVAASKLVVDGTSQPTLTLTEGYTYKFDTSDSTLSGHTFSFATAADAAGSTQYTTGVTTNGTPGDDGANTYTQIVVAASAPTLYYYCANHASMGGQADTPAEFLPLGKGAMRYRVDTKNQSYTAGVATLTFTDSVDWYPSGFGGQSTTQTITGRNFGVAAANRKIIVAVATAQPITGCTVAGVTATQIVASTGGDDMDTTIYVASVPTGTSGTIIITMSGSAGELHTRGGLGVYAAYGISSTASDTFTTTSTTDPMSQTIDIPAGGVAVAITHMNKGPGIPALTWTGFTEDYELTTANASQTAGGGSKTSSSAVTVTVGVDSDIGINNNGFVGASFASDGSNVGSGKVTRIHGTSLSWS